MKIPSIHLLPAAFLMACSAVCSLSTAHAVVTYTAGDLLLGFHTAAGMGSNASFVFNLGSAVSYRDNPAAALPINNIGTALGNAFGANWFSRTDLYWGIAGVRDSNAGGPNTVVNGDPRAAIYISKDAASFASSTPWDLGAGSATISAAGAINDAQLAFVGKTESPDTGGRGIIQAEDATPNNWGALNPINGTAFGGILTGGVQGPLGGSSVKYLDLYRVLGRASASATPNTPVGQGIYVTTFSINSSGILTAVPEPSGVVLLALGAALPFLRRRRA